VGALGHERPLINDRSQAGGWDAVAAYRLARSWRDTASVKLSAAPVLDLALNLCRNRARRQDCSVTADSSCTKGPAYRGLHLHPSDWG